MSDRTLPVHAPAPHPPGLDPRRWWVLVLLCLAQFMVILDITVVNVALPTVGSDLQLDRTPLTWVVSAYTLCFGGLLLDGRLADTLGRRRIFLAGLGVFTTASLASGLAQTGTVLVAARAGQGVGAALLSPAALAIFTTTFHGQERSRALGIWAAITGAGAAVGVLAGTLATAAVIYGLVTAGSDGWGATATLLSLAIGLVLAGGFVAVERTAREPLVPLGPLTRRPLLSGQLVMLAPSGLLLASYFLASLYLQRLLGASLGVAVVSTIAAASITSDPLAGRPPVGGFGRAFLACALLVAVAAAWLLPSGRPPAPTAPPSPTDQPATLTKPA
jgi:MFS family permease